MGYTVITHAQFTNFSRVFHRVCTCTIVCVYVCTCTARIAMDAESESDCKSVLVFLEKVDA